ncbi:MAG: hypothetical protein NUV98_03015 [Candidatus Roizmanbacteria bacterium]|nr:hypothetical protein [Candidatus Roizmanbacteria bacterium]
METQPLTSPQPPDPIQPTEPSHHKPLKLILIVIGIILASAVLVFAYQSINHPKNVETWPTSEVTLTPTSYVPFVTDASTYEITDDSNMEGWKTFNANTTKYSIDYPSDWFINPGNPNQFYNYDPAIGPGRDFNPEVDKDKIKIEISTSLEPYPQTIDTYVEENPPMGYETPLPVKFESVLIGEQKALKAIDTSLGGSLFLVYVKNPTTGHIQNITVYPRYDLHTEFVDQILSTFRFLDEETSTENWETYRNDEYGFEFKYPPNITVEETAYGRIYLGSIWLDCPRGSGEAQTELPNPYDWEPNEGGFTTVFYKEISMNNMKGVQFIWSSSDKSIFDLHTSLLRDGKPLVCDFQTSIDLDEKTVTDNDYQELIEDEVEYNQILSTFRFLDEGDQPL